MPSYTATASTWQTSNGTSLSVPYPSGDLTGNLLLIVISVRNFAGQTLSTAPSGFTQLATSQPSTNPVIWLYGRIGDGSETGTVSVDTNATNRQHAVMFKVPPPTGYSWPAIATSHVASTTGSTGGSVTTLPYGARTISANGNLGIQIAQKPTTGTVTALATTSGFTQLGYEWSVDTLTGIQYRQISGDISAAAETITGNTSTSAGVWMTSEFAPELDPTVTAASNPEPGQTLALTLANWSSAPTTITVNGVTEAFSGSPSTSAATMAAIPITDFVASGDHAATRWNSNVTLTVSNGGGESASTTIQIANPTNVALTNDFAARSGTQYYAPAGSADGDDFYVTWDYGGGNLSAAGAYFLPTTLPARGQIRWYDVSAVSWQALAYSDVFSADEPAPEQALTTYCPDSTTYTNLILWSNEFGHSAWTKTRASVVYDATEVTPRKTGAWTLVEDGTATNTHYVEQTITPAASTIYTARAVVKASNRTQAAIALTGAGNSESIVIFELVGGTFVATSGAAPTGYAISELEDGSGYWVISLYWTTTSTASMTMRVYAAAAGSVTFSGASQESLIIADAMIHTGSTTQDYIETERATMASNKVLVRSMLSHNLVARSNTMSDAAWTKTRSSISGSIALNAGATGGWQSSTIYRLLEDATASSTHFVANTADAMVGNPSDLVTCRFVAQGDGTRDHIAVRVYGDSNSNYYEYVIDLSDGTTYSSAVGGTGSLHSVTATLVDTVSSRPVYEVKLRGWPTTTSDTAIYQVEAYNHNGTTTSYNGTGTNGVYVGKVHVYNGYETTPNYVETTGSGTQPFAGTINSATIDGVSATAASANRSTVTVTLPGVDEFDDAGTHVGTRWYVAQDLVIGDGSTTDTGTITFEPCFPANFATIAAGFSAAAPTGTAEGDDGYIRILSGDGTTTPATLNFTPSEASTIRRMVYDVSGGAWLAYSEVTLDPIAAVGGVWASLRRGML